MNTINFKLNNPKELLRALIYGAALNYTAQIR